MTLVVSSISSMAAKSSGCIMIVHLLYSSIIEINHKDDTSLRAGLWIVDWTVDSDTHYYTIVLNIMAY